MPSSCEGMAFCRKVAAFPRGPRMPAWTSIIRIREGAVAAALFCAGPAAQAGHELSYYPAFYPQEIRIEPLDPEAAANQFANTADPLHAYIGAAPRFAGAAPAHLKSIASLRSFIVASANPHSPRLQMVCLQSYNRSPLQMSFTFRSSF